MEVQWEVVTLSVTIIAGSIAWLYQKAAERQERRIQKYERIMELANSFLRVASDPAGVDQTLTEIRKLWLSAPIGVVRAATAFREATDGGASDDAERAFQAFVQAMRRDCSLSAALVPRLQMTTLLERDIKLMVAQRGQQKTPPALPPKGPSEIQSAMLTPTE